MGKRWYLVGLVATLLVANAALADPISFTAVGTFGSSGTSTLNLGGSNSISFAGAGTAQDVADGSANLVGNDGPGGNSWSYIAFGFFDFSKVGSSSLLPVSDSFTLTITQLLPTDSNGNATLGGGIVHGNVAYKNSQLQVTFEPSSFNFGGFDYSIAIPGANTNFGGITYAALSNETISYRNNTLEGIAYTPEPSSILLFGSGLSGLTAFRRFSRKKSK